MNTEKNSSRTQGRAEKRKRAGIIGLVAVVAVVAAGYMVYRHHSNKAEEPVEAAPQEKVVPVVAKPPEMRQFEQRIVVQGNVEAVEYAVVSPRIQGAIDAVYVDEGDPVIAGETKLFEIDKINLANAVALRKGDLEVARYSKIERAAGLKMVKADFTKIEQDYQRYVRLFEKGLATPDEMECHESDYKQVKATLEHSQALLDLAGEQEKQAEVALVIAEKNLDDAVVLAPVSGTVSERMQEPGEMGQPGKPIVRIENPATVEISAYLPAQYYASVIPNQTNMSVTVAGIDVGRHAVSYRSPTVNDKLRTFEVKALVQSPPEGVVPGSMAEMVIILDSRQALGVPSEAILERAGKSVVFTVKDGLAHQVVVQTGLETDTWTEITEGDISQETAVVTMGQQMVDDGVRVSLQEE